jgi:hypothetical protein
MHLAAFMLRNLHAGQKWVRDPLVHFRRKLVPATASLSRDLQLAMRHRPPICNRKVGGEHVASLFKSFCFSLNALLRSIWFLGALGVEGSACSVL